MLSQQLVSRLLEFRAERDWEQFHTLRTLSVSLVLEASELLEVTQWTPDHELETVSMEKASQIKDELADIAILLTYLSHDLGVDIEQAVAEKVSKNADKYPVSLAKGTARKYSEL